MKYVPTKNLAQVWHRPDERKEFEDAAEKVAKEQFVKTLGYDGYNSIEEFKEYLREFSDADLMHDVYEMQEEADDERCTAGCPDSNPEDSFWRLVSAIETELNIQVHKEVIAEMQ